MLHRGTWERCWWCRLHQPSQQNIHVTGNASLGNSSICIADSSQGQLGAMGYEAPQARGTWTRLGPKRATPSPVMSWWKHFPLHTPPVLTAAATCIARVNVMNQLPAKLKCTQLCSLLLLEDCMFLLLVCQPSGWIQPCLPAIPGPGCCPAICSDKAEPLWFLGVPAKIRSSDKGSTKFSLFLPIRWKWLHNLPLLF